MPSFKKRQLRAVVDTNLFISGSIIKSGYPHQLVSEWKDNSFILLISQEQRDELVDVFTRPKIVKKYNLSKKEITSLLFLIDTAAIKIPLNAKLAIEVRDPKDEYILATALKGEAEYLVTGDEDLLVLNGNPALGKLKIASVREFLKQL